MAASKISSAKSQKNSRGIGTVLASALLELLLICMLLLDAIFSYLITKFASHYGLQKPCMLCSRLDHILGNTKLKYYWDLMCGNHKLEISSLVFCHAHNKLVDVHGMCESCLFSFATINKSNTETYRLLVGKMGEDSSYGLDHDPLLDSHISSARHCSCCNEPWISRGCAQKPISTISRASEAADFDVPLSGVIGHDQDNLKKSKQSVLVTATHQRDSGLDPLSHVGYTKLKINSDTESEVTVSDDAHVLISENNSKEGVTIRSVQPEPCTITSADNSASETLIDPVSAPEPSVLISHGQSDIIESNDVTSTAHTVEIGHGLEELNWQQADCEADPSALPEFLSLHEVPPTIATETTVEASKRSNLISIDDVPSSSDARKTLVEASKESKLVSIYDVPPLSDAIGNPVEASEENKLVFADDVPPSLDARETSVEISKESKLISLADVLPSSNGAETPVEGLTDSCIERTEEDCQTSATECTEICKAGTRPATTIETASEANTVMGDNGLQGPNLLDLGDAYKLAVANRGRQLSGVLAEQLTGKDSSRLSEDLKLLLSQLSAAREHSINDMSPRVPISPRVSVSPKFSINSDDLKTSDAFSAMGMQILQKRISLERNESSLSLDGSISEIEGESVVDRLKRQIKHDKKLLSASYKELEEERNASAIAANQAMAMITRLQEEKATLHMEALQCLRIMEEQAEYDMEALQKTNDFLAEKEKEIQDLEVELEFYRNKCLDDSTLEDMVEPVSDVKATDIRVDHSRACSDEHSTSSNISEKPNTYNKDEGTNISSGDKNMGLTNNSLLELEDERSYISRSLKKLEKKLYLFTNSGLYLDLAKSEYSVNEGGRVNGLKEQNSKLGSQLNSQEEEKMQNDRGSEPAKGHNSSLEKSEFNGKENMEIFFSGQSYAVPPAGIDLDSLANEVASLKERLEALEADRNFLDNTIKSIRNGEEGVRFIQEIASHLKELRRMRTHSREQIIS